ncbi:MAG: DUF554 domain-containing protein [Clostridia bacterium]|nr:DUF554 domain-containing protein [Clostridia bacterium]
MFGVFVNVLTVLVGSSCGLLFRKALPRSISDKVMVALGLCTVFLGVDGMIDPDYGGALPLIIIVAMVLGTFVGALLRIDDGISRLGTWVEGKFSRAQKGTVAQGFVTASLVFCVGSMTVVGSLQAGLEGDYTLLLTKSLLDLVSSSMLAASLGIGVLFSALFVLVFQGGLVLLSGVLQPVLTAGAVDAMVCAGALMMVALGLNLVGATKLKVADYLPALVFAPALWWLWNWISPML